MILIDTHVLVWWLTGAPGLSTAAQRAIAENSGAGEIVVSAISLLEIATAVRRGRLQFSVPLEQWLADMRSLPELRVEPVSAEIAALAGSLPDPMHGDPADRLIAATASVLGIPLVTGDEKLREYREIETIW
ncbi:MAG: type II toxin-antitoxin system VapC family toxin [Rhodocyclaceae bacterium]